MKIERNYILLLVLTCAAIFFVNLNALPINIMEARNFITAREMLHDGHWLLTTINGEPRYQKPPLPTWLTAFSAAIFGIKSVWALRLPAALMSLCLVFFSYKFAKKLILYFPFGGDGEGAKRYAFISALVMATSFYIVASARDGQWDIYTHGFMMGCIYLLYLFFTGETHKYRNALLAGLFFGCSFLSKGPVSLYALLLPFLIAFGIVYKYKNFNTKWIALFAFLIVAFVVSAWWHWYTMKFDPAAAAITKKETTNWINYEIKPFYYYWSFFTQSGVWTIPAFIGLLYPYLKNRVFNKKAYLFTLLWTIISVVLLSLIPEKKSRYLLPVLIPMALNTGFYIEYLFRKFKELKDKKRNISSLFQLWVNCIYRNCFSYWRLYFFERRHWWQLGLVCAAFNRIILHRNFYVPKSFPKKYCKGFLFDDCLYCCGYLVRASAKCRDYQQSRIQSIFRIENFGRKTKYQNLRICRYDTRAGLGLR